MDNVESYLVKKEFEELGIKSIFVREDKKIKDFEELVRGQILLKPFEEVSSLERKRCVTTIKNFFLGGSFRISDTDRFAEFFGLPDIKKIPVATALYLSVTYETDTEKLLLSYRNLDLKRIISENDSNWVGKFAESNPKIRLKTLFDSKKRGDAVFREIIELVEKIGEQASQKEGFASKFERSIWEYAQEKLVEEGRSNEKVCRS